jgi:peptidoglycan/LPS O-acetylase OafA/YrhL
MGKLRLILAISVVIAHTTPIFGISLIGEAHALHIFFIISGFYMSMILIEKYTGANSYQLFITNRFLRIYPVYWTVLIITVIFSYFLYTRSTGLDAGQVTEHLNYFSSLNRPMKLFLILSNLFIFGQNLLVSMGFSISSVYLLPQAWTIAFVLCFYLIAPFLLRKSLKVICISIVFAFSLRFISLNLGAHHDMWNSGIFLLELGFFLSGNLAYRVYVWLRANNLKTVYYPLAMFSSLLVIILYYHLPFKTPLLYSVIFICMPVLFLGSKQDKLDRTLGDISYPVYISYYLLIQVAGYLHIPQSGWVITSGALLFSLLLNIVVSKRIEIIRQKRLQINYKSNLSGLNTSVLNHSAYPKTNDLI